MVVWWSEQDNMQTDRPMVQITAMPHYTAPVPKRGRVEYDTADPSAHAFVPYDNPDPRTASLIVAGRNGGAGAVDYDNPAPAAVDYDNPSDLPRHYSPRNANRPHHSYHAGDTVPPPAYQAKQNPRPARQQPQPHYQRGQHRPQATHPHAAPPQQVQRWQQPVQPVAPPQHRRSLSPEDAWAGPPRAPAPSAGFVTVDPRALGLGQARPRSAHDGMDLTGRGNRGGAAARGYYPSAGWG